MLDFLPTIILRHRKENLKKCSLTGLEKRKDFLFYTYPIASPEHLNNYCLLSIDAPPLSPSDSHLGLYLIDATWRYAEKMTQTVPENLIRRSIPSNFRTAYPRRQTGCVDEERGLASIEALFIAFMITNRCTNTLLDHYHFGNEFLEKNQLHHLSRIRSQSRG